LPVHGVIKKRLPTMQGWGRFAHVLSAELSGYASSWLLQVIWFKRPWAQGQLITIRALFANAPRNI
jgi:hypothetical protein